MTGELAHSTFADLMRLMDRARAERVELPSRCVITRQQWDSVRRTLDEPSQITYRFGGDAFLNGVGVMVVHDSDDPVPATVLDLRAEVGTCDLCRQKMIRTPTDCWHPWHVPRGCDGDRAGRPGREHFVPLAPYKRIETLDTEL